MDFLLAAVLNVLLFGGVAFCVCGRNSTLFKVGPLAYAKYALAKVIMTVIPLKWQILTLRFIYKVVFQRNHIVQAIYLTIIVFFYTIYFVFTKPLLERYESDQNRWLVPLAVLVINLYAFYMASTSDPGHITGDRLTKYMDLYEHDGMLFKKESVCNSCTIIKPARSKHCAKCGECVIRFDHHCIFINNCVGLLNMRYFILYVTSVTAVSGMLALWAFSALSSFSQHVNLFNVTYTGDDGAEHVITYLMAVQYLGVRFPFISLTMYTGLTVAASIGSFSVFHISMILVNTNTNELYKRFTIKDAKRHNPFYKTILQNIYEVIAPNSFIRSARKEK